HPALIDETRREALHPAVDRDVVRLDAPLGQQLLYIPIGNAEAQIPAHRQHDHLRRKPEPSERRTMQHQKVAPPSQPHAVEACRSTRPRSTQQSRRSSIKIAGKQLNGCAGFLLVTSTDRSVSSLLGAGSVYQRALLRATDLRVAHHTMSYALEEDPWRQEIDSAMQSERPIQFMVRIGQARRLARPTIRCSMATLLENGMP